MRLFKSLGALALTISIVAIAAAFQLPMHDLAQLTALSTPAGAPGFSTGEGLLMFAGLGLLVNKESLEAVFLNIRTTFNNAFTAVETQWRQTAMLVPSGSSTNNYNWLSRFPKMREWIGDKTIKALSAFKYVIPNRSFEATVEVDRDDIEDDNLGIYRPQAEGAAFSAAQLPDEIVADLKNQAFVTECYDGQFFYDTDHPVGDGDGGTAVVSNTATVALSAATNIALSASYGLARVAVMKFKDDEGRPLGLMPRLLEVAPALEATALVIANNEKLLDDTPNPYRGTCTVLVNPRLTSDTQWMLHVTNMPVMPFIYQERKAPSFVQQTDPEADGVFMQKKFRFGAEARAAGGYGLWQLSFGSTGTG